VSEAAVVDDLDAYYLGSDEAGRLARGIGPLEMARTQELMERYLPAAPGVVYDVGAGPGAYSFWLAEKGYEVHMVDAVGLHIEQARERARRSDKAPKSIEVGDGRALEISDASADAVILHGPLYHLCERTERVTALAEARRVLRPGGVVLAFAITRYASVLVGLVRGWMWDEDYVAMCDEEVSSGQHHRPQKWPKLFTRAYFHHPDELAREVTEAGFVHEATLGVQGAAWLAVEFEEAWKDQAKRETLLKVARQMEADPIMSPHMVAVARRP
jgi:ubiquinone/menaquinone biosynthesis C-methylase UbiE